MFMAMDTHIITSGLKSNIRNRNKERFERAPSTKVNNRMITNTFHLNSMHITLWGSSEQSVLALARQLFQYSFCCKFGWAGNVRPLL